MGKLKVSKEEFAKALFYWLTRQVNTEAIKQAAKLLDFKGKGDQLFGLSLKNKEDFSKLAEELLTLNMWIIARTCQGVLDQIDKRNECLDIFHRIVHQRLIEAEEDCDQWALSITAKYIAYDDAMKEAAANFGAEGLGLLPFGRAVSENFSGKPNLDIFNHLAIANYTGANMEALAEALKEYDVK